MSAIHFSLILDTGSDLNWVQCAPCYACFLDTSCQDPQCRLVSSPDPPQHCKAENQTCPYFYWYGDSATQLVISSLETLTGKAEFKRVEMFGCGH
ncbi:hypothetical protein ACE6H2_018999 [Prunus campanulata]